MSSIIIDVSELRDVEGESVKELAEFLEEKIEAKIDVGSNEITVKTGNEGKAVPSKAYLRVLLRKFLHRAELKGEFRVISSGENVLMIKTRREARSE
ncbi:MAG: 60S ribosomal protein L22 [Candidatus Bathyarchaeia archaeon]